MAITMRIWVIAQAMILVGSAALLGCGTNGEADARSGGVLDSVDMRVPRTDVVDAVVPPDVAHRGKDTGADTRPDGAVPVVTYPPCACGPDDDCNACFARIGECCYEDPSMGGQAGLIARNCDSNPSCKPCCSECAARSCEEIKALNGCPAL